MNPPVFAPLSSVITGALLVAMLSGVSGLAEAGADDTKTAPLSPQQQQRLQEVERLAEQAAKARKEGKLAEAVTAVKKLIDIQRDVYGKLHGELADSLESLAELYVEQEQFAEARTAVQEVLAINAKLHGNSHYTVTDARLNLAYVEFVGRLRAEDRGRLREARQLTDQFQQLYTRGKWREALPLAKQSLEIYRRILGDDDRLTAAGFINVGNTWVSLEEPSEAGKYLERALSILQRVVGENHPDTANALNSLGRLMKRGGDALSARHYYEKALKILEKSVGENHADAAPTLNNLGDLLMGQGDYGPARAYFQRAAAIWQKEFGEAHPHTIAAFANLGEVLRLQEDYEGARKRLEQVLGILESAPGKNHFMTFIVLNRLGMVLMGQKQYAAAEKYFRRAQDMVEKQPAPYGPDIAYTLNNLGAALFYQGESAAARSAHERALAIRTEALGENHPETVQSRQNLGLVLLGQGNHGAARLQLEKVVAVRLRLAHDLLGGLSEAEALAYVETIHSGRDPLLTVLQHLPGVTAEEAYTPVWATRARATEALMARRKLTFTLPEATALWEQLGAARARLARESRSVPQPEDRKAHQERVAKYTAEKERLERQLGKLNTPFRRQQASERVGFADLAARLPQNVAVLDLARTMLFEPPPAGKGDFNRTWHYQAFVLRRANNASGYSLVWVHLGASEPIDRAIRAWREQILPAGAHPPAAEAPEHRLRRLLWEPVEAHLKECSTVVIIPDAALTGIPWAALPGKRPGSYLLEEYAIGTAGHGAQLYDLLTREPAQGDTAFLIGGVDYDAASIGPPVQQLALDRRDPVRDADKKTPWSLLAGTLEEVDRIRQLWKRADREVILKGNKASKAALGEYLPHARYVHLATHGFFRQDGAQEKLVQAGLEMIGRRATVAGRNPLLLSGLVLAGANRPQKPDGEGVLGGDDGILTAEEVLALDLSGTELLVLSACDTGLGEVAGGEGVFGLQRAFHLAGARTVVASLWKVDDRATQVLMTEFYRNLWHKGHGKLQALREAQLTLRRQYEYDPQKGELRGAGARTATDPTKPAGKTSERLPPFFWAAFVLSGDWR